MKTAWLVLFLAGLFEVGWAVALKYADGFTRLWPSALAIGGMLGSFVLLSLAMKQLPLGTAYTVWTGIGAVGSVIAGILLFKEPAAAGRIICMALILVGIAGLNFTER
ncbi:MAG TPA: multidrug efflux SMR transporter [Bryobacteraceae bacterium]|nr:multidrug efflux SMR transporter [Bryobacteraceae bacterium]